MNRLKEIREEREIKQKDVASIVGVHLSTVSKYELGTTDLPTEMIAKFCKFYDVTADYLLGLSNQPHATVSNSDAELLQAYHAAPLEIQKIVNTALEAYRQEAGKKMESA